MIHSDGRGDGGSQTTCRCLRVALSPFDRLAVSEKTPGLKKCFKMVQNLCPLLVNFIFIGPPVK